MTEEKAMAKCSVCGQDKATVDRHMFDGACVECTDKCLEDATIAKKAEKNNELLKQLEELNIYKNG